MRVGPLQKAAFMWTGGQVRDSGTGRLGHLSCGRGVGASEAESVPGAMRPV